MTRSRKRFAWGTPSAVTTHAVRADELRATVSGAGFRLRFDTLGVNVQGAGAALADAALASVLVPLASPLTSRRVRLTARLRGAVVKTARSRLVIALSTNGHVETIEVPAGRAVEKTLYRKIVAECAVPSDGLCAASVWLLGVRATEADAVVAGVDSLDVVVEPAELP